MFLPIVRTKGGQKILSDRKFYRSGVSIIPYVKTFPIEDEVVAVLRESTLTESGGLRLPDRQLERPLYDKVDKVLKKLGGRWHRASRTHMFQLGDVTEHLASIINGGKGIDVQGSLQYYATPPLVVQKLCRYAGLSSGAGWTKDDPLVLEPSCGTGAILLPIMAAGLRVVGFDIHQPFVDELERRDCDVACVDFLETEPQPIFDAVVMNPPFANNADCRHAMHAHGFLKKGGVLASVMSPHWLDSERGHVEEDFQEWLYRSGGKLMERLPSGTFSASGTQVSSLIVRVPA